MTNPGFRVFTKVNRPSKELVQKLRELPNTLPAIDDLKTPGEMYSIPVDIKVI